METKIKEVVVSDITILSLEEIFSYGTETFSLASASVFIDEIEQKIQPLSSDYLIHPECRFSNSEGKIYQNLIFGNYLIIYRITQSRIEVLNVIHGSRSVSFIKSLREIKI